MSHGLRLASHSKVRTAVCPHLAVSLAGRCAADGRPGLHA